jgi:c-di-GMP-binding flagellar brake protein YcgR
MRYARNMRLVIPEDGKPEKRHRGRFARPPFRCSLGTVEDVSSTGMRLRIKKGQGIRVGQKIQITLDNQPNAGLAVVKIVWLKKAGFRQQLAGLEFVDVSPGAREAILSALSRAVNTNGHIAGRLDYDAA